VARDSLEELRAQVVEKAKLWALARAHIDSAPDWYRAQARVVLVEHECALAEVVRELAEAGTRKEPEP
jgi:hypothetical protein